MKKSHTTTHNNIFLMSCVLGFFVILSSTMSKSPVLKPFSLSLRTPPDMTGIVASASTIPGILVSLPAATLSDVYGKRRFLLIAALVFASAPLLYLLITAWWQLVLVRFYHGFATAIFVPVAEASIVEMFPERRGTRLSLFSSFTNVGRVIAPTLGGYILFATALDFHALYLSVAVAGVTALIIALLTLKDVKKPDLEEASEAASFRRIYEKWPQVAKNRKALLAGFVQASQYFVYGSVEFFLAGYLLEIVHLDSLTTGAIITSVIGVGIFARPWMGWFSDRIGRRIPIVLGCLISACPLFFVAYTTNFWILLTLVMTYGLGFATVMGSTPALISEVVPKELTGTSMGFLDTVMDIGQTLGPIVSGFILGLSVQYGLQYSPVFPFLALVLLAAALVFALSGETQTQNKTS